jgi:LDH2 family malate/lactate/ureidoglycolate dehydrogenase
MNIAMEKAKNIGIGLVAARRSNHFGIAGYYSLKAVDKDLIGWAVCLSLSLFLYEICL